MNSDRLRPPWAPTHRLVHQSGVGVKAYPCRGQAWGREPYSHSAYARLLGGTKLQPAGRPRRFGVQCFEARPFGEAGARYFVALLPEQVDALPHEAVGSNLIALATPNPPSRNAQAGTRAVTTASGRVSLRAYVAGIRLAIERPDVTFSSGLTTWWSTTGAEIRQQFLASIHDRINQGVPYVQRGA